MVRCQKLSGARPVQEVRPQGRGFAVVSNDHCHGLPARIAGNVWIGEVLRGGRRGKGDDQGDGENDLLYGSLLSGFGIGN
jgi:hypothetical protein